MTLEEFLKKLAATPRDWTAADGPLRRRRPDDGHVVCPIVAVAGDGADGKARHLSEWREAACDLGLPGPLAACIVRAADRTDSDYPQLRRQLVAACGGPALLD